MVIYYVNPDTNPIPADRQKNQFGYRGRPRPWIWGKRLELPSVIQDRPPLPIIRKAASLAPRIGGRVKPSLGKIDWLPPLKLNHILQSAFNFAPNSEEARQTKLGSLALRSCDFMFVNDIAQHLLYYWWLKESFCGHNTCTPSPLLLGGHGWL